MLEEGSKEERKEAALELADCESKEVIDALVKVLREENPKSLKEICFGTLLSFKDRYVADKTVELIVHPNAKVRAWAIEILSQFGDYSLEKLEPYLKDKDHNIRKYALDVVGNMTSSKALELLLQMTGDPNPNVKYTSVEYLVKFKDNEKVKETIENLLDEASDPYAISTLIQAVRETKDKRFIEPLKKKLEQIKDAFTRYWIYKGLVALGDKSIYKDALMEATSIDAQNDIVKDIILVEGKVPEDIALFIKEKGIPIEEELLKNE